MSDILELVVPPELAGERLDRAVGKLAKGLSRARLKDAIEGGFVRVDGRRRPKGAPVQEGERITVDTTQIPSADTPAVPEPDAPLVIRFESKEVIVADKPAGQPTAPLRAGETGSLANALVGHYPELAAFGYSPREPGIVHRLDTDTSGLVVVGRTADAFEELRASLKAEALKKTYLVVVKEEGLPDEGTIEFPLTNHPKDQRRVYACVHPRDVIRYAPRPASTQYRVVERKEAWALVEAEAPKALRHQIRAHFAALGHPLAGDELYGGAPIRSLGRHALHASRVRYGGGACVDPFDVSSPLPAALANLMG
ncbi:MAG: RluA family pseudouridine synthase [Myxococcales bacterium]|nr:RluA family pseudouridine synthase [Myxococcales bacterium]